jgi:hypothetical protein
MQGRVLLILDSTFTKGRQVGDVMNFRAAQKLNIILLALALNKVLEMLFVLTCLAFIFVRVIRYFKLVMGKAAIIWAEFYLQ